MPKAIGHSSLSVTGCCFDSAVFEAMFRLIQQRHAGYWAENGFNDWGDAKDKRMMEDLIIGCPCAAHIAQTGFKWARWPHGDGAILKELFLVCEGLRNSITFLYKILPFFLIRCVVFDDELYFSEDVVSFWTLLGVKADLLQ